MARTQRGRVLEDAGQRGSASGAAPRFGARSAAAGREHVSQPSSEFPPCTVPTVGVGSSKFNDPDTQVAVHHA